MSPIVLLIVARWAAVGPSETYVEISPHQAKHAWTWSSPGPGRSLEYHSFSDGILAYTDNSITVLNSLDGKAQWTVHGPPRENENGRPEHVFYGDRDHVVFARLMHESPDRYYQRVLTLDRRDGSKITEFDIPDRYGRIAITADSVLVVGDHGARRYDLLGHPLPDDPSPVWPSVTDFDWQGGRAWSVQNEDYPMDLGADSGLWGVRWLAPDGRDRWNDRFMRRALKTGEVFDLSGKPARETYGPPICADEKGLWVVRTKGNLRQLVRIQPSGVLDSTAYPAEVGYSIVWTDRGIWFVKGSDVYRTTGAKPVLVAKIPGRFDYGQITRHGLLRRSSVKRDGEVFETLRLDPLAR